jgi:hypothetical protein
MTSTGTAFSAGDDKRAHITPFRQMDTGLFAKLRALDTLTSSKRS